MSAGDEYFEDLLKFNVQYSGERNTAENVIYAACESAHGATLDTLIELAEEVGGYWVSNIMPYVSAAISLVNVLCADWTDADGLTGEYARDTAGSLSGDKLPSQVCTLGNFETLMRYRGGRGRIYLPQPDATVLQTDQTWTTDFIEDVTTGLTDVFNSINELTIGDEALTTVLYHRSGNKVVEQGYEMVVGVTASATPGTQRRRVRRVGHIA